MFRLKPGQTVEAVVLVRPSGVLPTSDQLELVRSTMKTPSGKPSLDCRYSGSLPGRSVGASPADPFPKHSCARCLEPPPPAAYRTVPDLNGTPNSVLIEYLTWRTMKYEGCTPYHGRDQVYLDSHIVSYGGS